MMNGLERRIRSVIEASALSREELGVRLERCGRTLRPPGLRKREDRDRFTACLQFAVTDLGRLAKGQLPITAAVQVPPASFNPFGEARIGRIRAQLELRQHRRVRRLGAAPAQGLDPAVAATGAPTGVTVTLVLHGPHYVPAPPRSASRERSRPGSPRF